MSLKIAAERKSDVLAAVEAALADVDRLDISRDDYIYILEDIIDELDGKVAATREKLEAEEEEDADLEDDDDENYDDDEDYDKEGL